MLGDLLLKELPLEFSVAVQKLDQGKIYRLGPKLECHTNEMINYTMVEKF